MLNDALYSWLLERVSQIPIVIIGGYGDLAKKYLWQGVNNLDESYGGLPKSPLLLYSSGRAPPEVGWVVGTFVGVALPDR